jgi:hypothetical protein
MATENEQGNGSDGPSHLANQWDAFQKIWTESFTKMLQLGGTFSPEGAPPEFARQLRASILQAMAKSWDEFLRSPQFLEGMKQWMDGAITFRKLSNDFLTRTRHEEQSLAREDLDTVMLTVRHMETRILDRLEAVGAHVKQLQEQVRATQQKTPRAKRAAPKRSRSGGQP